MHLGKKPAVYDRRDILFGVILAGQDASLPTPPRTFGYGSMFGPDGWGMLGNGPDSTVQPGFRGAGDCVFAGFDHQAMLWTRLGGKPARFTGLNAIEDYSAVTNYVLGDDSTDQGTYVREANDYWLNVGVVDENGVRHKIGAYVALEPGDFDQLMLAVYLFGAAGIGFSFPESAADQFDAGLPWTLVPSSPELGGHYVPVVGRAGVNVGTCITWGRRQRFTRAWYQRYCDEAWAFVSAEELKAGRNPRGLDLTQLNEALQDLAR